MLVYYTPFRTFIKNISNYFLSNYSPFRESFEVCMIKNLEQSAKVLKDRMKALQSMQCLIKTLETLMREYSK